jgi:NTE family protein
VAVSGGRWLAALTTGWLFRSDPQALLDNTPLRALLAEHLNLSEIEGAVATKSLRALCITCSGFASGQCVSFFQGRADLEPWHLPQRAGAHVALEVDHVMASMAVPFLFPPEKLHREYFGDGAMRELAPLAPAIRLGADRILVIGTGRMADIDSERWRNRGRPTLAETAGHVLSGIYVDRVTADIERMSQVNRLTARIPPEVREKEGLPWRPIDLMLIQPTERLDTLAATLLCELPWAMRTLLRGIGVRDDAGGALVSYLMFEAAYTQKLIDLGYRDAMARRGELSVFLDLDRT